MSQKLPQLANYKKKKQRNEPITSIMEKKAHGARPNQGTTRASITRFCPRLVEIVAGDF